MHKTVIMTSELKKSDIKLDVRILTLDISGRCSLGLAFVDFFVPLAVLDFLPDCVVVRFAIKISCRFSIWFKDYLVDHPRSDLAITDYF